jgi:hypothetical protein
LTFRERIGKVEYGEYSASFALSGFALGATQHWQNKTLGRACWGTMGVDLKLKLLISKHEDDQKDSKRLLRKWGFLAVGNGSMDFCTHRSFALQSGRWLFWSFVRFIFTVCFSGVSLPDGSE